MTHLPPAGARAVVLGASLGGLLAARILSERFAEVVLLERDTLPEGPAPRKGTPHAVHPHGLLARGREVLEELFPGFTAALVAQGGVAGDLHRDAPFEVNRQRLALAEAGQMALAVSRLAIEAEVRRRVLALPGVRVLQGVDVLMPQYDPARGAVVAARYRARDDESGEPCRLACELVLDCTGRASHLPQWLQAWGLAAPVEERVEVGLCYTSAYFRREGELAQGRGVNVPVLVCGATAGLPRPGVLLAQEPGADGVPRWVLGLGGYAGDHAAPTMQALREYALHLGSPELVKVTQQGERLGEIIRYQFSHSLRRRYERLARFPAGLLALGDALTSFNPIYGQGMTVAACEALELRRALQGGMQGLHRRFFAAAARIIDTPWQLAVGGDLAIPTVPGPRPLPVRLVNAYIARLQRAAVHDAAVAGAFVQVMHMRKPPASLFSPGVLWRVWRGGARPSGAQPRHATALKA